MKRHLKFHLITLVLVSCLLGSIISATPGVSAEEGNKEGLISYQEGKAFNGYSLFTPMRSNTTYLIDMTGRTVNTWESEYKPGISVYLLENGNLLRTGNARNQTFRAGGAGGRVQEYTWDNELLWDFEFSSDKYLQHHDIELLPNGNILMIAWEYKSGDEAITMGRNPDLLSQGALWPDMIIEIKPVGDSGGEIVWEWHIWDHMIQDLDKTKPNYGVVKDHPELIDLNYVTTGGAQTGGADWTHINSVDYNETFDQILLSLHGMSEIYVIDHSTTVEEAASHKGGNSGKGGDILYRWGNPQVYGAGDSDDQILFAQHDAEWIPAGSPGAENILIFNNGQGRQDGSYSSIEEITPPVDDEGNYTLAGEAYGPSGQAWTYSSKNKADFYADHISGSQRLPNGNTLICSGTDGRFFEVTPEGETVWEYICPEAAGISTQLQGPMTGNSGAKGKGPKGGGQGTKVNSTAVEVFRVDRYSIDYPGLAGRALTPGDTIE